MQQKICVMQQLIFGKGANNNRKCSNKYLGKEQIIIENAALLIGIATIKK